MFSIFGAPSSVIFDSFPGSFVDSFPGSLALVGVFGGGILVVPYSVLALGGVGGVAFWLISLTDFAAPPRETIWELTEVLCSPQKLAKDLHECGRKPRRAF